MGLIFCLMYQHHDPHLLSPVAKVLYERGHNVVHGSLEHLQSFLATEGPRALLMVSDIETFGHAEGQASVKMARWKKIPSISIQHGIPVHEAGVNTTADLYCLWGAAWDYCHNSPEQTVTGNPAMDRMTAEYCADQRRKLSEKVGIGAKALLIPAIRPDADTVPASADPMDRAALYLQLAKDSGWTGEWIVRPHPSDLNKQARMEAYAWLVNKLDAFYHDALHETLYELLPGVDFVLGTSTAVLEGLQFGCQVQPLYMPYLPPNWETRTDLFMNDGQASVRIADLVEERMVYARRG